MGGGDGAEDGRGQGGEAEEFHGVFEAQDEAVDDKGDDVGSAVDLLGAADGLGGDVGP